MDSVLADAGACHVLLPLLRLQALVDRPDEVRKVLSFKRMALTDFKLDIPRLVKKTLLKKALSDAGERSHDPVQRCAGGRRDHRRCRVVRSGALHGAEAEGVMNCGFSYCRLCCASSDTGTARRGELCPCRRPLLIAPVPFPSRRCVQEVRVVRVGQEAGASGGQEEHDGLRPVPGHGQEGATAGWCLQALARVCRVLLLGRSVGNFNGHHIWRAQRACWLARSGLTAAAPHCACCARHRPHHARALTGQAQQSHPQGPGRHQAQGRRQEVNDTICSDG